MPGFYCCKQEKHENCQRPWGSPLDTMGEIISSQCPAITLKIQSADRIFVFLSADKHHLSAD